MRAALWVALARLHGGFTRFHGGSIRRAVVLATAEEAPIALPGVELSSPPTSLVQVQQLLQTASELAHLAPGSVSAAAAREAVFGLYGNYTLTQISPPGSYQNFVPGVRVQIVNNEIFYAPVPNEVVHWMSAAPQRYHDEFAVPAAHLLSFLSQTTKEFKVPDVDVTFVISDFCFGITRGQGDTLGEGTWGLGANPLSAPPNEPPAALTSSLLPPVFTWNSARSGRKTCNAVATTSYDWTLPAAMPGVYEGPAWESRKPKLIWRGSLIGDIRSRLVRFGLNADQNLFDLKIAGGFDCAKYVQEGGPDARTADCPKVQAAFVELSGPNGQQQNKYILDVDGGASTWRLKSLLSGGWAIFKVDSSMYQFWYQNLVPFVHYIPVDRENLEHDLPSKVRWAMEHDAEVKQIALNAKQFATEHLTWDRIHWQQYMALSLYAKKQVGIVQDPVLSRFCCKDLQEWPHLSGPLGCVESPSCAAEPLRPAFVREDWKAWGDTAPTVFPPWYTLPTQPPTPDSVKVFLRAIEPATLPPTAAPSR